ncbi:MAG: peptidase M48 [Sediminimonas qiaohouensis]|uniref:Peptidase M48 n=1 Tax=Sediminimonas qiaohouensis TaxID=552061 RepID=A0A7C9L698_9RHOB|nr:M48 family metalloprotease [Sediminimonas qiaohouensis]MTJ03135.1 peptidase M48 [Sediminimonas qiaohouensis]
MRPAYKVLFALLVFSGIAGCAAPVASPPVAGPRPAPAYERLPPEEAARQFTRVVDAIEPVAEAECRARAPALGCDYRIVVDTRTELPPNAFQTVDDVGRPVIGFTIAMVGEVRNADELAFVMAHEAAHHIRAHIPRQRRNATAGAILMGGLAALSGADGAGIRSAQDLGASVGARSYSKEFELEADSLGTVIAARAGFDPLRGAEFFTRIPDPGNRFLGTHPPNAARIAVVRRRAAGL